MATDAPDKPRSTGDAAPTFDLAALSEDELRRLVADARDLARSADGLAELFDTLATEAAAERRGRDGGGEPHVEVDLSADLDADPLDVVTTQRDAMARAVELRDDAERSEDVRAVWAVVVDRLGLARRAVKKALAERRRDDPREDTWAEARAQAALEERRAESEDTSTAGAAEPLREAGPDVGHL